MPPTSPRSRIAAAALAAAVGVGLVSMWVWGRSSVEVPRPVTLHVSDRQGAFLIPASVTLPMPEDPAFAGPRLLAALQAPPGEAGLAPVPAGARWVEGTYAAPAWRVKVSLSEPPGSTGERLLVGSLVRTLLGYQPGAREVFLSLVDAQGRPLPSQHLDLSGPLTLADVTNQLPSAGAGPIRTTLWWPGKDSDALVPVQVSLSGDAGLPAQDAFDRLVAGPGQDAAAFLKPVVPAGVQPRWGGLADRVATVELSGALPDGQAGARLVEAIVLSLTELPEVTSVRFTAGGRPIDRRVGPFELARPVARPSQAGESAR